MLIRSLAFGVMLFVVMMAIELSYRETLHWQAVTIGTILAMLLFYVYQRIDQKKEENKS